MSDGDVTNLVSQSAAAVLALEPSTEALREQLRQAASLLPLMERAARFDLLRTVALELSIEQRAKALVQEAPALARIDFHMEWQIGDEGHVYHTLDFMELLDTTAHSVRFDESDIESFGDGSEINDSDLSLNDLQAVTGRAWSGFAEAVDFLCEVQTLCYSHYDHTGEETIELRPLSAAGEQRRSAQLHAGAGQTQPLSQAARHE